MRNSKLSNIRFKGTGIITALVIMVLMFTSDVNAYKFDFVTVTDIVNKVKKKFGEIDSYEANFVIVSEKMGKKTQNNGDIKYKATDKLLMNFYNPPGQKIVANGKMMWIYIPALNVVAEQDLKSDTSIFSSGTKMGLKRLFSKYHYKFDSKTQPEPQKDGTKMYTLLLNQKESRSGFRTLKLWISEDFFITKAMGTTSSGKKVEISFSQIRTNVDLSNGLFKFSIPSMARVIKNPLISEE